LKLYSKDLSHAQHSDISKVTIFGPFFGPSSDLYTRAHKRNYEISSLLKEEISFSKVV